jgi:hypothetical protein
VELPAGLGTTGVWRDGRRTAATRRGAWWALESDVAGRARLEVR